jgi:hypothetical protein
MSTLQMKKKVTIFFAIIGLGFLGINICKAQTYKPIPVDPDKVVHIKTSPSQAPVSFEGNIAIANAALLEVAELSYGTKPAAADMPQIIKSLYSFYHKAGYDLVRLEYATTATGWVIYIDEGVLSGIQIYGLGWYDTFRLRNSLLLNGVYNRKQLEEKLAEWVKEPSIGDASYEMVRNKRINDLSTNEFINDFSSIVKLGKESKQLKSRWGWQLRIYFERSKNFGIFSPGIGYSSENGLELDASYRNDSVLLKRDSLEITGMVGINTLSSIDPANDDPIVYFNAHNDIHWQTPHFGPDWLRLFVENDTSIVNRQRPDLPLDRFQLLKVEPGLHLEMEMRRYQSFHLAVGYEFQYAYDVTQVPTTPFVVPDDTTHSLFIATGFTFLFGDPNPYHEFNHRLGIDYKRRFRDDNDQLDLAQAYYQRSFTFTYADLITRTSATYLYGDSEFFDEFPLEELGMRTNFDRQFSVQKSINHRTDLRLNFYENKIQAGPFQDITAFAKIDRTTNDEDLTFAYDFGPAFYFVFFDSFQLYFNYAFGFTSNSDTSSDFHIGFEKIFR